MNKDISMATDDLFGDDGPEYDAWFRAQVWEALEDTTPGTPHETVMQEWAAQRAALAVRAGSSPLE